MLRFQRWSILIYISLEKTGKAASLLDAGQWKFHAITSFSLHVGLSIRLIISLNFIYSFGYRRLTPDDIIKLRQNITRYIVIKIFSNLDFTF